MEDTMDAILFSARPSMVTVDDAIRHLANHKELYWSVGFKIVKKKFSFPMLGFIHIAGGENVEYRVTIDDILPFDAAHYENPSVKPEPWRREWKDNVDECRSHPWKNDLVITRIDPFSCETKSFKKPDGGSIKLAPQSYARVLPPSPESSNITAFRPPRRHPVPERHLEAVVVHYLPEIEPGLTLEGTQLDTPAGRLDLLCKDTTGTYVVVELKRSQGSDQVLGQILRYMGWVIEAKGTNKVRGIIIVQSKDRRLSYAIKAATNVQIKEFRMVFDESA